MEIKSREFGRQLCLQNSSLMPFLHWLEIRKCDEPVPIVHINPETHFLVSKPRQYVRTKTKCPPRVGLFRLVLFKNLASAAARLT